MFLLASEIPFADAVRYAAMSRTILRIAPWDPSCQARGLGGNRSQYLAGWPEGRAFRSNA